MFYLDYVDFIFLAIGGFFAAFINAIVGGGGLISLPILLFLGIPIHSVLGTNKLAASSSSLTAASYFIKHKKVNLKLLKWLIPFTLLGAILGVKSVIALNEKILYYIVPIVMVFFAIYTFFSKTLGLNNNYKPNSLNLFIGILMAFLLGFYDGFLGPGTGTFLIFGFIKIFRLDFVMASGNAKVLNFVSNIVSLIMFAINGKIYFIYGIFMAVFMAIGGIVGSKVAINKGAHFIKYIFVIVALLSAFGIIYNKLI